MIREDVGRHNAVDKCLGYAFLNGRLPLDRCLLLVSGRASFEIMQKEQTLGAGSTYQTMASQRDLAVAELDLATAMTVYEKAKVELDRATGSTLEHNGIEIQDAISGTLRSPAP